VNGRRRKMVHELLHTEELLWDLCTRGQHWRCDLSMVRHGDEKGSRQRGLLERTDGHRGGGGDKMYGRPFFGCMTDRWLGEHGA
jgi:hypothetical protein